MTAQEMQKYFLQEVDSIEHERAVQSEDIIRYINKAVYKFVKDHFEAKRNRARDGFEQSVKRIEDLRELISTTEVDTTEVTQQFQTGIYADKASIPTDNFLLLSVGFKVFYNSNGIDYTVTANKRQPDGTLGTDYAELRMSGKFIQHDDIYTVLSDPFNKPRITKGIFTVDDNNIYSYTDNTFITDKIVITYIRQPQEVSLQNNQDCDLSESVHEDIVDLAVDLFLRDRGLTQSPEA